MADLLGLVLVSLAATALLWGGLRLAFPRVSSPHRSDEALEALHARFAGRTAEHLLAALVGILLGMALAYAAYRGAEALLLSGRLSKTLHYVGTDRAARALVALLGGAAVGLPLSLAWMRRRLGADYPAYIDYQNRLTGLANERATRALAAVSGIGWAVTMLLFVNWYTAFGPQGVVQNPLFSLRTRTYAYEDVEALQTLAAFRRPDGRVCDLEHYRIRFRDGRRWDSRNSGFEDPLRNRELFGFLAERTGLELQPVGPDGLPAEPGRGGTATR